MSETKRILIVDDDQNILEVLEARLQAAGYRVYRAASGPAALDLLKSKPVDVLVSDMKMPEMSGMELFVEAVAIQPQLPVIFLTAYGTIPDAVTAVKAGAVDYLTKPFDGKELVKKIAGILATVEKTPAPVRPHADDSGFIWGTSPAMQDLKAMLMKVAGSNANVLILGESGVGKEYIAKLLHHTSARRNHPYIVVDCGSTPA
ncbi:MAG: sigma-54 dependent DNA-binding response regulator (NtrC-type regulator), partial [uncultured bacterium]